MRKGRRMRPNVLYIMGTGRSGTTILEVLLTQANEVAGAGELTHIWRDGFIDNTVCSCGVPTLSCPVWGTVHRTLGLEDGEVERHARRSERIESHRKFPLLVGGFVRASTLTAYAQSNVRLIQAVQRARQVSWVVDSSKYASRALLLAGADPDTKVVCLTRGPVGLISAFQKRNQDEQRPKPWWAAALYYTYVLACMRVVRWKLGARCIAVRYEDLTEDPVRVLKRIQSWAGLDLEPGIRRVESGDYLEVGHIVTGNRLRKLGRIQFRHSPDREPALGKMAGFVAKVLGRYRSLLGY